MKKKYIISIIIVIAIVFGITQIDFSSTNQKNTDPNISIGKASDQENAKKLSFTIDMTILKEDKYYNKLASEYQKYVSEDGYLINNLSVEITKDYTVSEVLDAIAKEQDIAIEYGSFDNFSYIKGINHISEKAIGDLSGWMYTINGEYPSTGIDQTKLNDGDKIVFVYSSGEDMEGME
ncbi:DUF4430 domain-containing protein [Erysipelotrichaceae bacterium OttesenSCG-928-M19]|nr:DUF4430 domain-containing protein [Erysipelotrichaceae bacterium OttesenSCG-928-M19]